MSKVLIIGAGGVGGVVAHKAAMETTAFSEVMLASRRIASCEKLAAEIEQMHGRKIATAQVDADDVPALTRLLKEYRPKLVVNVALPYQDLTSWRPASRPTSTTSTPRTTSRSTSPSSSTRGSGPTRS